MTEATRFPAVADALVAVLAGVGAVSGSYAAVGLAPAFLGSPLERVLSRAMPGPVVAVAIERLGSVGQQLNLLLASFLTALAVAVLVWLAIRVGDQLRNRAVPVVLGAAFVWAATALVTVDFASATGAAAGAAFVVSTAGFLPVATASIGGSPDPVRRRVVGGVAAALGLGTVALTRSSPSPRPDQPVAEDVPESVRESLELASERSLDVSGIEPLVSRDFYQVDINAADPRVDPDDWSLAVTGAVESVATYSLDDLRSMDERTEFSTLRCVGDSLNGQKLDNALWTGVPTEKLIDAADPVGDCDCVKLHAADGYFQVFPTEALRGGLLAYEMNGRDLPRGHGYPLRALVPGHWGEVQVKWLTEIEFLERDAEGYWEQRGWHGTGPVSTVAKLWAVDDLADGRKQVAGHAYAGTRGISKVEVSTDGGDSWNEARLSDSLPGEDVWRQWVYEYDPPGGSHEVVVRAVEDDGTLQSGTRREAFPNGATGWVSKTVQ